MVSDKDLVIALHKAFSVVIFAASPEDNAMAQVVVSSAGVAPFVTSVVV